ncbi:MAG: hypothetical protein IKW93_02845 [Bacteroidales bacterium]|nr:hypothetical protein [Bacteroidales bacterium]
MIPKKDLLEQISASESYEEYLKIARKHVIHGTPFVFKDNDEEYYEFRDSIAKHFKIGFHEVLILGSAKLGYSYHKDSEFSSESDIDVALVNEELFESYYINICNYQYDLESGKVTPRLEERKEFNQFIHYLIKGWMRPDMLPERLKIRSMKEDWFEFFKSISYDNCPAGNYKVSGGLFKNYYYLEKYYTESLIKIKD